MTRQVVTSAELLAMTRSTRGSRKGRQTHEAILARAAQGGAQPRQETPQVAGQPSQVRSTPTRPALPLSALEKVTGSWTGRGSGTHYLNRPLLEALAAGAPAGASA